MKVLVFPDFLIKFHDTESVTCAFLSEFKITSRKVKPWLYFPSHPAQPHTQESKRFSRLLEVSALALLPLLCHTTAMAHNWHKHVKVSS